MPGGIGQRFLHQPQHSLGHQRIGHAHALADPQLQLRPWEGCGQRVQCGGQVEAAIIAHRLHHLADVSQQFARQLLGQHQAVAPGQRRISRQRAQVQPHRGELVARHIMQFARQAQALGIAGAVGQQCARGQKIRVDPGQVIAGQGPAPPAAAG
ncbi:hypothetical protein G6F23_014415 [Rhizopus arrhizus]|nr:hypothetical protein G6F23_014415 [Rhizopus arrhizus]